MAFLSPLLGETNFFSIGGVKIPALLDTMFFFIAFILSRRKEISFLCKNRVFQFAVLYFIVVLFNYGYVLHDFFFKVFDELTPLWLSLFRRIILVLFIFFAFRDEFDAVKLFYSYCAGLVLSALCAYPEMIVLKHNLFDASINSSNEGYYRALGFFTNPNDFALTIVIAGIFILHYYLYTRKKLFLIIYLLLLPPLFWTYSRNGLACLIMSILLIFYLGKKINFQRFFYLFAVFIGLFAIVFYIPSVRDRILSLFSGEDSSLAARTIVLLAAFQKWLSMPIFGIGIYSTPLLFLDSGNSGLLLTIHNFYAHALIEGGVINFLTVLSFLFSLYKLNKKNLKKHLESGSKLIIFSRASLIALLITYFYIFSGNHINFEFFWYLVGIQLVMWRSVSFNKENTFSERIATD